MQLGCISAAPTVSTEDVRALSPDPSALVLMSAGAALAAVTVIPSVATTKIVTKTVDVSGLIFALCRRIIYIRPAANS